MENASKNAGEMYGKLELIYNRARQANITNKHKQTQQITANEHNKQKQTLSPKT